MTQADWFRVLSVCFAIPNIALCKAFAIDLWLKGDDPVYRPVFRAAFWAYTGMAIVCAGSAWGMIAHLHDPLQLGLYGQIIGQPVLLVGMVLQFRHLPRRKW